MSLQSANLEPKGIQGLGKAIKRKEDQRFIMGRGSYVDDMVLPNMHYLAIVHSPYAHAKILGIDSSEALKVPGVKAVITSKELAGANLAWIPTLAGDKQMVLADGKVVYQYQEVAAVIATTRQAAADGAAAVQDQACVPGTGYEKRPQDSGQDAQRPSPPAPGRGRPGHDGAATRAADRP